MYQLFSGNYDRSFCPVSFTIPKAQLPGESVAVQLEDGKKIPAAISVRGDEATVTFVLDYLLKGEEIKFDLISEGERSGVINADLTESSVEITKGDYFVTRYYFGKDLAKPYMGPFKEKYGKQVTRLNFEIKEHPHHRSLWFSHGAVNGVDTWNEPAGKHGFILNNSIEGLESNGVYCEFTANNTWTDFNKSPLCDDVTKIRIYSTPEQLLIIDTDLTLSANYGDVTLGKTKEAGPIAVRMNDELVVGRTGKFVTPTGVNEDEIWMKRAPWCDYCGVAEGHSCGITIMDNPENEGYPTYWHARNYGLMAPNNSFIPEEKVIKNGESANWKFRVMVHNGDTESARVADHYANYIAMPLVVNREEDGRKVIWPVDPERAVIPFKLPEDLTGWPEIPKWKKDMPAFMKWVRENDKLPKRG
ncbi:MAG: PmoA family protein [Christensenellales bacterium]|jgi:hypothetical protein